MRVSSAHSPGRMLICGARRLARGRQPETDRRYPGVLRPRAMSAKRYPKRRSGLPAASPMLADWHFGLCGLGAPSKSAPE